MTKKTINASKEIQSEDSETYTTLLNLQKSAHDQHKQNASDMKSMCTVWATASIALLLSEMTTFFMQDIAIVSTIVILSAAITVYLGEYLSESITMRIQENVLHQAIINRKRVKGNIYTSIKRDFQNRMKSVTCFNFTNRFILLGFFGSLPAMLAVSRYYFVYLPNIYRTGVAFLVYLFLLIVLGASFSKSLARKKCFWEE